MALIETLLMLSVLAGVVVVANLKSRQLRFGVSQGMVLAAGDDGGIFLVGPDAGASAGLRVR